MLNIFCMFAKYNNNKYYKTWQEQKVFQIIELSEQ